MSHVTLAKCGIRDVNKDVLHDVLMALTGQLNGTLKHNAEPLYMGSTGHFPVCDYVLTWAAHRYGLGISIVDGELAFTVDWWDEQHHNEGHKELCEAMMSMVRQWYQFRIGTLAIARAGFDLSREVMPNGLLHCRGVA